MRYDEKMMITSETYRDDEVDEIFSKAIDEDRTERERLEGIRVAKRLAMAFILIMVTGAACWVVLPRFGMVLPVPAVLMIFGVMAFASLAPLFENRAKPEAPKEEIGRPIKCGGPRPIGELSRQRRDRSCGGGSCGCS